MTIPDKMPFLDLGPDIRALRDDLLEAVARVIDSHRFILGPEVRRFEEEAASYLGVRHTVGVNSGTDALVIGLRSLGIGAGDEVITSPFTFFATAEAIMNVGARPVFADIDLRHISTFDAASVEGRLTASTRALLPVHLFGLPADWAHSQRWRTAMGWSFWRMLPKHSALATGRAGSVISAPRPRSPSSPRRTSGGSVTVG